MKWFAIETKLISHPKMRRALAQNRGALEMWIAMRSYVAEHETDGTVSDDCIDSLGGAPRNCRRALLALSDAGLIEKDSGFWRFHDFEDHAREIQSVRAKREAERLKKQLQRQPGLSKAVRERDQNRCRYCGKTVDWADHKTDKGGTLDHVIPRTRGGANDMTNLVVACRGCNSQKRELTPEECGLVLSPVPQSVPGQVNGTREKHSRLELEGEEEADSEGQCPTPTSLETALVLPVAERAAYASTHWHAAEWLEPNRWPEVRSVAEALADSLGQPGVLGDHRDHGVRAVVDLYAAGFSETDLLAVAERAKSDPWWHSGSRGLSSMSVEVVRRALAATKPTQPEAIVWPT